MVIASLQSSGFAHSVVETLAGEEHHEAHDEHEETCPPSCADCICPHGVRTATQTTTITVPAPLPLGTCAVTDSAGFLALASPDPRAPFQPPKA